MYLILFHINIYQFRYLSNYIKIFIMQLPYFAMLSLAVCL